MNATAVPRRGPTITALLVDDERLARVRMRQLLEPHDNVVVTGEAASVDEAVAAIAEHRPDVIFLDVQMKPKSGFDLLAKLPEEAGPIHVVFVTAHDTYAVRAFEENTLDYLTKPVLAERLAKSIERLGAAMAQQPAPPPAGSAGHQDSVVLEPMDYVLLRTKSQQRMIRAGSIRTVEAREHATVVGLEEDESVWIGRRFASWEKQLPTGMFLRVSRGLLVNLTLAVRCEAVGKNSSLLFLDGRSLPIELSRLETARVKKALGQR